MDAVEALENLELIGIDQWGLVATSQAAQNGISKLWMQRLSERGIIHRLRQGIYALPSSQPGHLQDIRAAWLSITTGPTRSQASHEGKAVASGATAAEIHGIGNIISSTIEFSVPYPRMTKQSGLRLIHRDFFPNEVTSLNGLPATTVERTIFDLSNESMDLGHLTDLVFDAAQHPDAKLNRLAESLDTYAQKTQDTDGQQLLNRILEAHG